ncbi:Crp/Fnr family transcriptional regulator [Listeria booriae]|uniref:Crp/Fnr family transcriptional regulator n=1 Tax=Listeria booriae TaxID=1552123 RepID=A0A841YS48_9LIST|nr:Crp/Fnr family transcriptional regulator [Listeria booriae]MBC1402923.1 Crp/Fnr family transcriptional regulator [Listeria booriae]MBC1616122.1 Crp/Fnr family transcriptional regulator [Listeria booriae]MBC2319654.1 Crp/Fnr family transcriptional regulator [Listeria booriae]
MYHDWSEMTFSEKQEMAFHSSNTFFIIKRGIVVMRSKSGSIISYLTTGDFILTNLVNEGIIFYAKTEVQLEKQRISQISMESCIKIYNRQLLERLDEYKWSAPMRLCLCLKQLANKFGTNVEKGIQIAPAFTQYDLADYCNLKREYVSLLLRKMIEAGIIRVKPKPWMILNMEKLDEYALKKTSNS